MAIQQTCAYQPLFFLSGGRLGKLCYEQTISTWVVKSDLLIGVKLKHVLTMGDKSPGIRTPLYKETNIVPNDCCRICRIYVKISGRSKINVFGYNNKDFSYIHLHLYIYIHFIQIQTLSICSVGCVQDSTGLYVRSASGKLYKFARVYQSRLLYCLLPRGAPFASIPGHFPQNSNINMYSGNLARILVWRLHFPFLGNNGARKSHAAQQTLKVRNVISEAFVDPMLACVASVSNRVNRVIARKLERKQKKKG